MNRFKPFFVIPSCGLLFLLVLFAGCADVAEPVKALPAPAARSSLYRAESGASKVPTAVKSLAESVKSEGAARNFTVQNGRIRTAAEGSDGAARNFTVQKGRRILYRATLVLQCPDIASAIRSAEEIARKYQGYAVSIERSFIRLKVPREQADAAMKELEALGLIADRRITAQDVTEQVVDTQVRLDNLRKLRERMVELLARAHKVEDALKIEKELARITTELERYEATLKNLALQTALVDISIRFNSMPVVRPAPLIPIPWVRELGTEISRTNFPLDGGHDQPFEVTLPAGFVILSGGRNTLYAVNAVNTVIKLSWHDNYRGGNPEFYLKLLERNLFDSSGFRKTRAEIGKAGGVPAAIASGERQLAKRPVAYEAVIMIHHGWLQTNEKVYVLEIWGKPEDVKAIDRKALFRNIRL